MISDNLWNEIKNFTPNRKSEFGKPSKDARTFLSRIMYVIVTGSQCAVYVIIVDDLQITVHGGFKAWVKAGVFEEVLYRSIIIAIRKWEEPQIFFKDTSSVKDSLARFAGKNPTDRGKHGIKKKFVIDWNRIILSILVEAANKHDSKILDPTGHPQTLKNLI